MANMSVLRAMLHERTRQWRANAIFVTLAVWFASLLGAVAEQQRAHRLAANPVVTATVRGAWSEHQKGGPVPYAHLEYDRKQPDGQSVHCDVPWVNVGGLGRMKEEAILLIHCRPRK